MSDVLSSYVDLAFHTAFPRARIKVAFNDFAEMWVAAVDDRGLHIYTMVVGSDDDEFHFTCISDKNRVDVSFPIPENQP